MYKDQDAQTSQKGFKAGLIALLIAIAGLLGYQGVSQNMFGGGTDARFNQMGYLTSFATSTGAYCNCPVKLLTLDADRRYAKIQNNSDTSIFIYATTSELDLTGTGAARYATGSITILNGIELAADGTYNDELILMPEN